MDLQNDQVARAFSRWPVDVMNLSRDDLMYARKLLASEGMTERVKTLPMIKSFISANLAFGPNAAAPAPYVIKEVAGPRIHGGKKPIKIGFVGVASSGIPDDGAGDVTQTSLFRKTSPAVLKARKECDVLVIVAYCDLRPALTLAAENMEADVLIVSDAGGFFKPRQVGNTLVVSAAPGNVQEGDLRVYLDKEGKVSFKFRSPDLDALVPSDPAAAAFVQAARLERERPR